MDSFIIFVCPVTIFADHSSILDQEQDRLGRTQEWLHRLVREC